VFSAGKPPYIRSYNIVHSYSPCISRVGQNRIYLPYMTVYLVISLQKYRIYTVYIWFWANPMHFLFGWPLWVVSLLSCCKKVCWHSNVLCVTYKIMSFVEAITELADWLHQGCVIWRIRVIRCIVLNAYFTVLYKLGRIIRLQHLSFLPFWGLLRQFLPRQRPFSERPMLSCNILVTYNILEKNWERFGWF
jgi:hypothetical protein